MTAGNLRVAFQGMAGILTEGSGVFMGNESLRWSELRQGNAVAELMQSRGFVEGEQATAGKVAGFAKVLRQLLRLR